MYAFSTETQLIQVFSYAEIRLIGSPISMYLYVKHIFYEQYC